MYDTDAPILQAIIILLALAILLLIGWAFLAIASIVSAVMLIHALPWILGGIGGVIAIVIVWWVFTDGI